MTLKILEYKKEQLYSSHLQEIGGVKFTAREVDVIACILHNRGEKKIAAILSIAHRTISSHIRNIMGKLSCSSRDTIIDIVEKSGKRKSIHQYYFYLMVSAAFKKQLRKIGTLVNRSTINCSIDISKATDEEQELVRFISEALSLANVMLQTIKKDEIIQSEYKLYFVNRELITDKNSALKNNIALLADPEIDQSLIEGLEYINFTPEANYYHSVFKLLENIIIHQALGKIVEEFYNEYLALQDSLADNPSKSVEFLGNSKIKSPNKAIIGVSLLVCCIFFIAITIYNKGEHPEQGNHAISSSLTNLATQEDSSKLLLTKYFTDLSVCNLTRSEAEKNYSVIKHFDEVIRQITSGKMQQFSANSFQPQELINSLYNLNSIASYSLFKEHDAEKAEKILLYGKKISEDYVSSRSKTPIDFSKLTAQETYTELSIIKDLPELYTITIYFLGRSHIYRKNIDQAEKYFKISKFLGHKLGLFEEFLSEINGLAIIKGDRIEQDIQNKNYEQAKISLLECIEIYEKAKNDSKEYKKDYRPSNQSPIITIPKAHVYNFINSTQRITRLYTKLIEVTGNNKHEQKIYMNKLLNLFIGTNSSSGVLKILIKSDDKLNRIAANTYNDLGYFLLKSYQKNLDFKEFAIDLATKLNFADSDELGVIAQIFDLAKSLSRNTEFTKADSYDGLVRVYELMTKKDDISAEKRQELLVKIKEFKSIRDEINKALKRVLLIK